ncbi:MAG: hypothetical protein O7G87_22205 [bacterium]|nr:hypothetical protein [bacterium]
MTCVVVRVEEVEDQRVETPQSGMVEGEKPARGDWEWEGGSPYGKK